MNDTYTGGCACGDVRYEIDGDPWVMNDCQCRDCQRRSGTGRGSYVTFPHKDSARISGVTATWNMVADSGNPKVQHFCPRCGVPLYVMWPAMPDLISIHVGSMDEPSRYVPTLIAYTSRGNAWDIIDPALAQFPKMPSM